MHGKMTSIDGVATVLRTER